MFKRAFLVIFFALILSSCTSKSSQPNVVLVIIDTLRADKLGAYGFGLNTSPEIDAIASKGLQFNRVISQSSWTRTSIGSFLTSQYPRTLGIYKERWDILPERFTTLAEILKSNGYTTIGLTANPNINTLFRFNQGFDAYTDSNVLFPWMKKESGKQKANKNVRLPKASELLPQAVDEFTKAQESKKPIYLQINIMDVHDWSDMEDEAVDPDLKSDKAGKYLQCVRTASKEVGKFVDAISKLDKNTLFILVADHGEGLYDHPNVKGSLRHGNLLYESHVVVPLIFFNPGDSSLHGKIDRQIRLLDLLPTTLDYLKLKLPQDIEGVSVLPLLGDPGKDVGLPDIVFSETEWRKVQKVAIYGKDWKYIENRDGWEGVNPKELQAANTVEDGIKTDRGAEHPDVISKMGIDLTEVEKLHLKTESHQSASEPSTQEIDQLKSLGYLK